MIVTGEIFLSKKLNSNNKIELIKIIDEKDLLNMDPIELQIIIGQGSLPEEFKVLLDTNIGTKQRLSTIRKIKEKLGVETVKNNKNILPKLQEIDKIKLLDKIVYQQMDEEAIETLVQYKLHKLWNSVLNKQINVQTLENEVGGEYFTQIKNRFLTEYNDVIKIKPKDGYSFKYQPSLMQQLTVFRLLKNKEYGNWSGTGAGKTLSFILSSRELDARLTLVIVLNSTIVQTEEVIKTVYPDSKVYTNYVEGQVFDRNSYNYLVLNYEKFQQEYSEGLFQSLTNNNQIDFVVIDEVHNVKQRDENGESIRREVLNRLLGRARAQNSDLHTLAMSATPVINNLFEAKSLLSMMTGLEFNDINTRSTIENALSVFRQLLLRGVRYLPEYEIGVNELTGLNMSNLNIDGSHLLDDLLKLNQKQVVEIEKLLLDDKLKSIEPYLKQGVIVYSHFTTGIFDKTIKHIESLGFKVRAYSGDESTDYRKETLGLFRKGKIDIIIASDPITTGVDGLQDVCDRMILLTLPWTDSMYTQLKGRIYRQGSAFANVEFIIPQVTIALDDDKIWSWDIQRLNLIKNKRTLADAAVDGLIPSKNLPSPKTLYKKAIESLINWKERLNNGQIIDTPRALVSFDLYPDIEDPEERERRIQSELSEFNRKGKITHSSKMNKEFTENPESFFRYHKLRSERMEQWGEIPYEYIATKIKDENDIVIDFGCGENNFKNCIPNNKVISFDHISFDETVIACDVKDISDYVSDSSVDVTVFSLSLWGSNSDDYIKEAYRVLRHKGVIYIAEPMKNYETEVEQEKLIEIVNNAGFQIVGGIEKRSKFIYLTGIKI